MTPERWRQVEQIYNVAQERSPGERTAYLAEACRDDGALRHDVESLLAQTRTMTDRPLWRDASVAGFIAGTQLGPYKVEGPLGAGGMGQVFRGVDTRLGRPVAIKVSHENFSARFEREAQAISALNHPNICTLYDVGPNYLVMELVEGDTLAARIKKGALPMGQVLLFGSQIADALVEAHSKGIIHRDLKPGNAMIAKTGIKVLDFGLAKRDAEADSSGEALTASNVIMGTPAYMAPEQQQGGKADARSDIFSLGLILGEMATGKRPLVTQEHHTPPDGLPPAFAHIVERCLALDPDQRWQNARDLKAELDWAAKSQSSIGAAHAGRTQSMWRRLLWPAVAAAALGVSAAGALVFLREKTIPQGEPVVFQIPIPEKVNVDIGGAGSISVSPDARWVAFYAGDTANEDHLWLRRLDSLDARSVPGTESGSGRPAPPIWSPDSRSIVFESQRAKLMRMDVASGAAQELCDLQGRFMGGDWNRDDVVIFAIAAAFPSAGGPVLGRHGIMRVAAAGGSPTPLIVPDPSDARYSSPSFLPGGKRFLYVRRASSPDRSGVFVGSLDAKPADQGARRVSPELAKLVLSAEPSTGYLLFLRAGTLLAQRLDLGRLEVQGEPSALAEGLGNDIRNASGVKNTLIYRAVNAAPVIQPTWFDRQGKVLGTMGEPGRYTHLGVSHDGRRLAASRVEDGNADIWIYEGKSRTRFTFDPAVDRIAIWSPDDRDIAFYSTRPSAPGLYRKPASGASAEELLAAEPGSVTDWSPDGRFLCMNRGGDQWILPMEPGPDGKRKPFPFIRTPGSDFACRISPDGRYAAYLSNESGRNEIYVVPFKPTPDAGTNPAGGKWMISKGAIGMPRWRADSKEMYYLSADGKMMAVEVGASPAFHSGPPAPLFPFPPSFLRSAGSTLPGLLADATSDGQRFLLAIPVSENTPEPFTAVLNWTAKLKR